MKKIWILFLICLFITCPVLGCPVTKNKPISHPDGTIEYHKYLWLAIYK